MIFQTFDPQAGSHAVTDLGVNLTFDPLDERNGPAHRFSSLRVSEFVEEVTVRGFVAHDYIRANADDTFSFFHDDTNDSFEYADGSAT